MTRSIASPRLCQVMSDARRLLLSLAADGSTDRRASDALGHMPGPQDTNVSADPCLIVGIQTSDACHIQPLIECGSPSVFAVVSEGSPMPHLLLDQQGPHRLHRGHSAVHHPCDIDFALDLARSHE